MSHADPTRRDTVAPELPLQRIDAVLFDLDGVVTDTARVHAAAWARMFDAFLRRRAEEEDRPFEPFTQRDYLAYVDGRPRYDGVRSFLAARGIAVAEGAPDDPPELDTVYGLGTRKTGYFLEHIRSHGVDVYPSSVELIRRLRSMGVRTAVVTASRNRGEILGAAGLEPLFDAAIDGNDRDPLELAGKPAPDTYLEAARRLGVEPQRCVVVEDAVAGVEAGRRGGFGLVIGVDRGDHAQALRERGADIVVGDLAEVRPVEPETDPWQLVYDGFDPDAVGRRETLLALGNGYFVTRGSLAEAVADDTHYPGTYLAGGYNRLVSEIDGQRVEHEDLVNLPNWLPLAFRIDDGEWFALDAVEVLAHRQVLDLRRGVLERWARFRDAAGRETRVVERRFVHMREPHLAGQHVAIHADNWAGRLTVRALLDGDVRNRGVARYRPFQDRHVRVTRTAAPGPEVVLLESETSQSRLRISQAARIRVVGSGPGAGAERRPILEPARAGCEIELKLSAGTRAEIEKIVALHSSRDPAIAEPTAAALAAVERAGSFDELLAQHELQWAHLWRRADLDTVEIDADASRHTHLVVRLHIFHLLQTTSPHAMELDVGIPARGWHGEGYRGHIFWDELFIFPFLVLRMPILARSLLRYRYRRLPEARWAARQAGYRGAMFPWQSGSDGREETDVVYLNPRSGNWMRDDTHLQRHVGAAIALNVWRYYQATGDLEFLYAYGAELMLEIARFWASLARWNGERGRYDIRGVLGPDEFHDRYPDRAEPGLDNNAYTNVMAAWCLARAPEVLALLPAERVRELREKLALEPEELAHWDDVGRKLFLPFHADGVLSQFEGYEALEEFDWDRYRRRYDNIMRLDLILEAEGDSPNRYRLSKQADVLMLLYLFSAEELAELFDRLGYRFDGATIPRTIDFYLQRSSNGSTLSGVVHAWVLARSARRRSWPLFTEALRSDIDDIQGGTTAEGIHLGAMAGTVDLLQRCYTGLELRTGELRFHPVLPDELTRLSFRLRYREHSLNVELTPAALTVTSAPAVVEPITLVVDDQEIVLEPGSRRSVDLAGRRGR